MTPGAGTARYRSRTRHASFRPREQRHEHQGQPGRADGGVTVLSQIAEGVLVHQSGFMQSNAVVVQGRAGVLLIDPGVTGDEIACIANDLQELGQPVVAGFSTHPHWDHTLWQAPLGEAPRYGTARCAAAIRARLSDPHFGEFVATLIPPDIVEQVPLDLLGLITGVPAEETRIPWDGPAVRIIEHQAH